MKAVLLLLLSAAFASAAQPSFSAWKSTYGKHYTAAEEARRAAIFRNNLVRIEEMNKKAAGKTTFGATRFADLTEEEYRATFLGTKPSFDMPRLTVEHSANKLPENFDWRDQKPSRINPVQDQGNCGSCWAFSATSYLEGYDAASNKLKKLSEQQLVDCDHHCKDPHNPLTCDWGCNGGYIINGVSYAIESGMQLLKDYKYTAKTGKCVADETKIAAVFSGNASLLPVGDEQALKERIYNEGPVAVAVNAGPWSYYQGGVFDEECPNAESDINHGVLCVGWGLDTESGNEFWIIRNSWGPLWGEKGHIRLIMGKNICGIANDATVIDQL